MALMILTAAQPSTDQAESIELHDDLENPAAKDGENQDDPFAGMPEEEKKKYVEMQQIVTAGCILYSQVYFNTFGETTVKSIFEAVGKENHPNLFKKLVAALIKHCLKTSKGPDMIEVYLSQPANR